MTEAANQLVTNDPSAKAREMFDPNKMTMTQRIIGGICIISILGVIVTLTVLLGIFAYKNPDPGSCWVVKGLDAPQPTKDGVIAKAALLGVSIPEGYPQEMSKLFRIWFMWGFWAKIYMLVTGTLFSCMNACMGNVTRVLGAISCGLYLTNGLIWIVFGAIWRYSSAGKVASGDNLERPETSTDEQWTSSIEKAKEDHGYQFSSGIFIHVYVIAIASAIMITGAISILIGSIACFTMDPNENKEEEDLEEKDLLGNQDHFEYTLNDSRDAGRRRGNRSRSRSKSPKKKSQLEKQRTLN